MDDDKKPLILIVEDDPGFRTVVSEVLAKASFETAEAPNGRQGLDLVDRINPDLVILDIAMPEMDGDEVCRTMRSQGNQTPVIFLTARDEESDRIRGLELGGDDYVVKSGNFSARELVARTRAVLRRTEKKVDEPANELKKGLLTLDLNRYQAFWDGQKVDLTTVEFNIIRTLVETPNRAYNRDEIMDHAYPGPTHVVTDRTIDSHVRGIRRKFAEAGGHQVIDTVRGRGYTLGSCAS